MIVEIPSTGKPCTKCAQRDGNPLNAGMCNVCYSNMLFGDPSKPKVQVTSTQISNFGENIKLIFQILFGIFILWMIFGGLFEKKNNSNSVYIDCTKESYKNSQYCNGEYENQMQTEDYNENNYYQTIVR